MRFMLIQGFTLLAITGACGAKVDTGRNADPSKWPNAQNTPDQTTATDSLRSKCFLSKADMIPQEFKDLCDRELSTNDAFKDLVPILCDSGHLLAAMDTPECGWNGNASSPKIKFVHRYYMQKDTSQDYEDITSSIIRTPVSLTSYTDVVRLAFENFDEFKNRGYQWTSGTRENRNLSGTKWEDGINYRFRADKESYEVGYQGLVKYIQLTPTLAVHINRATGDYERIKKFAQIVIYRELPDQSTLTMRLEHRKTQSSGLFEIAKKSALDLDFEAMEKGYSNATKK